MSGTGIGGADDFENSSAYHTGNVFDNTLVVHEISRLLSTKDLKEARLVSAIWGDEGLKALRKRKLLPVSLAKLGRFLVPDKKLALFYYPNWAIKVPLERDNFDGYVELFADLNQNPTHLDLHFAPKVIQDFETFSKLMERIGSSLKSLTLRLKPRLEGCTPETPEAATFLSSLKYCSPSLQKLELFTIFYGEEGSPVPSQELQRRRDLWYLVCQNFIETQKENLSSFSIHHTSPAQLTEKCLNGLHLLQEGKLKALSISAEYSPWSPLVGELILDLPPTNLTNLHLNLSNMADLENEAGLASQIFLKYSTSLEKLRVVLPNLRDPEWTLVTIPAMPNLKVLQCEFMEMFIPKPSIAKGVSFGDGPLMYKKHFPRLQSLSIYLKRWCYNRGKEKPEDVWLRYKSFFVQFFHLDQICRTVVDLDVPYFRMEGGQICLTSGVDLSKLKAMFPCVSWSNMDCAVGGWKSEILEVAKRLKAIRVCGIDEQLGELPAAAVCTKALGRIKDALVELESKLIKE